MTITSILAMLQMALTILTGINANPNATAEQRAQGMSLSNQIMQVAVSYIAANGTTQAPVTSTTSVSVPTIAAQTYSSFSVTTPTNVTAGKPLTVNFTSKNAKMVNIYLCTGVATCNNLFGFKVPVTEGANSYTATVATTVAPGSYVIKVEDASNPGWFAYNAQQFRVEAAVAAAQTYSSFSVTTPTNVTAGKPLTVNFTSKNAKLVNIYLCTGVATCNNLFGFKVPVTEGANAYTATVATTVTPGHYVIKVEDASNPGWFAYNAQEFPIESTAAATQTYSSFSVTTPTNVAVGKPLTINFTSKNAKKVNITLCTGVATCNIPVVLGLAVLDGSNSYTWTVPTGTTATNYVIKVEDAANSGWFAYNGQQFPMESAVVTTPTYSSFSITTPTSVAIGKPLTVNFTSKNAKLVNIYFCTGVATCNNLFGFKVPVTDGANTYTATVATTVVPGHYVIKVEDASNPGWFAYNAQEFPMDTY